MKGIQFTLEEKQLLTEALLFTAVTDVCSEHTVPQRQRMLELAQRVNESEQKLHNIFVYGDTTWEDEITENVVKTFPNIPLHTIITD